MIIIGVDPGLEGAIAVFEDGPFGIHDIPTLEVAAGKKKRREYNLAELTSILKKHTQGEKDVIAVIEKVGAMPGQGVASTFKFGFGAGVIEGVIAALQIPYEKVTPQRWKKDMLAGMGKEKDAARQKAIQLFPDMAHWLKRKKDHGRADAMLLAEWMGRRLGRKGGPDES